jgi:hypothetical protein
MAKEFVCDVGKKRKQDAKLKSVPEIETLQGAILAKGRPSDLHSQIFLTGRMMNCLFADK